MRILLVFLLVLIAACSGDNSQVVTNSQGIFEFPDELNFNSEDQIPEYMDASKILCNGKGLKVARCISNQLKKGICLGIIKEGKTVYVVEVDCANVKKSPAVDSTDVL